ncbi:mitoferrin-2-like [Nerophis ophidion]|uniref:mitoferrin-2-like n=1 Tax=Nerophis ophidion TaxID=159077 RepID=UPI002AE02B9B|nr:mitoferrin-2-like [Nerophis ophidion]
MMTEERAEQETCPPCSCTSLCKLYTDCSKVYQTDICVTFVECYVVLLCHLLYFSLFFRSVKPWISWHPPCILPVVKQRMQMYNSPYRGVLDCIRAVWQKEGAGAFYRSYTTQLTMNVPFQALHFMTYEYLQELLNPHRHYNPSSHMLSGALAGALAAAATTPLDVCKTLLNTQESLALSSLSAKQGAHRQITGLAHAFRTVYRLGGLRGYFKGAQARVIYQMPSTAISWSVYEFFKYGLTKHQHDKRRAQQMEAET